MGKPWLAGGRGGLRPGAGHGELREAAEAEAERELTGGGGTEHNLGTCACTDTRERTLPRFGWTQSVPCGRRARGCVPSAGMGHLCPG